MSERNIPDFLRSIRGLLTAHPRFAALCLFVIVGLSVFGNTFSFPFVHDDKVLILANSDVREGAAGASIFSRPTYAVGNSTVIHQYYRPLLGLFCRLQFLLFGENPYGYHVANVSFHILNAFMVFVIMLLLTARMDFSLGVGLLFLVHPVQSEAVASIAGQSNTLVALFFLFSFYSYVLLLKENRLPYRAIWMGLFLGAWLLAFLIKEQAVILPFLLWAATLLIDPARGRAWSRYVFLTIVLTALLSWRSFIVATNLSSIFTGESLLRLLHVPQVLGMYLQLLFFPTGLHYYRSIDILASADGSAIWLVLAGILAIFGGCRLEKSERKFVFFGAGWFLLLLLPVLLVPIVNEYSFVLFFEHFLYLPIIGCAIVVMAFVSYWLRCPCRPEFRLLKIVFVFLVIGALGCLTFRQNAFWRGEIPLFERAVAFEPKMGRLRLLLGQAYENERHFDLAILEFNQARNIFRQYLDRVNRPEIRNIYQEFLGEAHAHLAQAHQARGDYPAALENYQQALQVKFNPKFIYNNLGMVYIELNNKEQACAFFRRAVELDGANFMAKTNWGVCLAESGDVAQARRLWQEVLAQQPGYSPARNNLQRLER